MATPKPRTRAAAAVTPKPRTRVATPPKPPTSQGDQLKRPKPDNATSTVKGRKRL